MEELGKRRTGAGVRLARQGVQLLLPQLGEAIEPVQVDSVTPWWRAVDCSAGVVPTPPVPLTWPKAVAWPMD